MRRSGGGLWEWTLPVILALVILAAAGVALEEAGKLGLLPWSDASGGEDAELWEKIPEGEAEAETNEPAPEAGAETQEPVEEPEPEEAEEKVPKSRLVFVGDSRTVGMYWALSGDRNEQEIRGKDWEDCVFSCCVGEGLLWMKETGIPCVEDRIDEDCALFILMGVNDIGGELEEDAYLEWLWNRAGTWAAAGADVYYVSVNPVKGAGAGDATNERIDRWNRKIRDNLPPDVDFLDTNTALRGRLTFRDVLHYTDEGSILIYDTIRAMAEGEAP